MRRTPDGSHQTSGRLASSGAVHWGTDRRLPANPPHQRAKKNGYHVVHRHLLQRALDRLADVVDVEGELFIERNVWSSPPAPSLRPPIAVAEIKDVTPYIGSIDGEEHRVISADPSQTDYAMIGVGERRFTTKMAPLRRLFA